MAPRRIVSPVHADDMAADDSQEQQQSVEDQEGRILTRTNEGTPDKVDKRDPSTMEAKHELEALMQFGLR